MTAASDGLPEETSPSVNGSVGVTDAVLTVDHVTLRFGGVTSISDLSFAQQRGEILAVIGPNGAGKTSLFNSVTGVYKPQEGRIVLRGEDHKETSLIGKKPSRVNHLGIARTFQNIRLFNALSVFENVKIGVEARDKTGPITAMLGLPRYFKEEKASDARTMELLEFVGLADKANALASSLSYGGLRRLEIARAIGTGPQLLLLDEPAAGTNPSEKLELADLIRKVNVEMGLSVLLIEHDMRLVMSIASRIVVLNFGRAIAAGTPGDVQSDPAVIEAYLGAA